MNISGSIFSIFELLSGITENDFKIRKSCLERINEQKIEIRGPMIDQLFMDLFGETEYNQFACNMIMDIYHEILKIDDYYRFNNLKLLITDSNNKTEAINAHKWLKDWDDNISKIINNIGFVFENENKEYIKLIYEKYGVKGLSKHFWDKFYNERNNEERLAHAEGFVGSDIINTIRQETDSLFSKYNFKLFMVAQAVIFSKAYFINGNTQNANNASDLLHLLYLNENDKFVSNDKIYQTISEACPEFELIVLNNEKELSELI